MLIRLTCGQLKQIYRFCGGAMDKRHDMPELRFIRLEVSKGRATAYALDRCRAAKLVVTPEGQKGTGTIFLPLLPVPKAAKECVVSADGKEIHVNFDDGMSYCVQEPEGAFPKPDALDKAFRPHEKATFSIWFNPRLLAEALKAVQVGKNGKVRLDFFSPTAPVVLCPEVTPGSLLVLPLRPPEGE